MCVGGLHPALVGKRVPELLQPKPGLEFFQVSAATFPGPNFPSSEKWGVSEYLTLRCPDVHSGLVRRQYLVGDPFPLLDRMGSQSKSDNPSLGHSLSIAWGPLAGVCAPSLQPQPQPQLSC